MPSVIEASEEFVVSTSVDKVWSFLTDLSNIGSCIPDCESVTLLDNTTALFKIRLKLGYLSRTFEIKAKLNDISPKSHVSFSGEGTDAEILGHLDLGSDGDRVSIRYRIEIKPISVAGKTAIAMIGKDLVRRQATEFASCVKSRLEVPITR